MSEGAASYYGRDLTWVAVPADAYDDVRSVLGKTPEELPGADLVAVLKDAVTLLPPPEKRPRLSPRAAAELVAACYARLSVPRLAATVNAWIADADWSGVTTEHRAELRGMVRTVRALEGGR